MHCNDREAYVNAASNCSSASNVHDANANVNTQTRRNKQLCLPIKVKWQRIFAICAMFLALMLIVGSIYLHLQQKHHFGRLSHEYSQQRHSGIDTTDWNYLMTTMPGVAAMSNYNENGSDEYDNYYDLNTDTDDDVADAKTEQTFYTTEPLTAAVKTPHSPTRTTATPSTECLFCMCQVTTECKPANCSDGPCGRFRISRPYWQDAALVGESNYKRCVHDFTCAERVVSAYISKYARDCNGDGIIDCRDYIALHILGPGGCLENQLVPIFELRMNRCFMDNNIFFN